MMANPSDTELVRRTRSDDKSFVDSGVPAEALQRYIEEQIFTLPGTRQLREEFSVLLTGSRATGTYTSQSDVDIDVVCPRIVYESVQRASLAEGRINSVDQSFYILRDDNWRRYFGEQVGRPHFSLTPIEEVIRHFQKYQDVFIWIWTNARVIHDARNQFRRVLEAFTGYPRDILVQKIKYRWMLAAYWGIDVFPHNHSTDEEILSAATALLNAVNELLRFFFLVEGGPFPYAEKLTRFVYSTELGKEFMPFLRHLIDLVTGREWTDRQVWVRLDEASRLLFDSNTSPNCRRLEDACAQAMLAAGVDPEWVEADYNNISELFAGKLGPMP